MNFKLLRVPSLGLQGVIAMAATAAPAVADDLTLQTFISVPAETANFQPRAFSLFDVSFADTVTGNIFIVSASIINRMLAVPELPPLVRTKILEYVEEKAAGLYGGSRSQRRKFAARLSIEKLPACRETESTLVPEYNGITGANGERSWVIPEGPFGSRS
jgi:hypothetical protein